MNQKINPIVATVIAVITLIVVGVGAMMLFGGDKSAEKQVIVKPDNPNDPKFQPKLPAGMSGGGK